MLSQFSTEFVIYQYLILEELIKSKTVPDRRVDTMQHWYEIWVALSESAIKKLRAAPPGGEIRMTSHPACNKTSLSRKMNINIQDIK